MEPGGRSSWWLRPTATALAIGLVAAAAGFCGVDAERDDPDEALRSSQPPGWEVVDGPSALEPLAVDEEPLWTSESAGPLRIDSAAFRDDSVVLSGIERDNSVPSVGVVEAATGEPRWSVGDGSEPPGGHDAFLQARRTPSPPAIVDHAGGWAVLAAYLTRSAEPTEYGLMALSGEDGHVLWQTPVVAETRDDVQRPTPQVAYAADGVAVVVVAGRLSTELGYGGTSPLYTDSPRLVAIDTADGTVLWEREGLGAAGVAGDTVFAYRGDETDGPHSRRPAASVMALEAATGEVRWDLSDWYPESALVLAAGDLALVKVPNREQVSAAAPGRYETLVVEAATGREVVSFGTTASECAAGDELVACAVSGPRHSQDRLATLRVDDREAGVSEAALPRGPMGLGFFRAIVNGRIFIGEGDHRPASTVDRFANTIDAGLPGGYLAMSDRYGIFEPVDDGTPGAGAYTVHRISGTG